MAFEENGNINEHSSGLIELNDSDYEIVDGEPDVEGWDVKDDLGDRIGEVVDLLFDPESRKVRYMIVKLDEDFDKTDTAYESEGLNQPDEDSDFVPGSAVELSDDVDDNDDEVDERVVLIPIGLAEFVTEDEDVILPGITVTQISSLPLYEKGALTPVTESYIRTVLDTSGVVESNEAATYVNRSDFYDHNHFNDDRFYNRQPGNKEDELRHVSDIEAPAVVQGEYLPEKETPSNIEETPPSFGTNTLTEEELNREKSKNEPLL